MKLSLRWFSQMIAALALLFTLSAAATASSAASTYDGTWKGSANSGDSPIKFTVKNNQISFVQLGFAVQVGDCSKSGSVSTTVDGVTISGTTFTVKYGNEGDTQFTFSGTFTSSTEASGTLRTQGVTERCSAFDVTVPWTAKLMPSSADVVKSFFDAINHNNLDAAMALVGDDVAFSSGATLAGDKTDLKNYLKQQMDHRATFTLSNVTADDSDVTFTLQTSDGASPTDDNSATVEDGLITDLTLD